jgi:hypothetical protein
MDNNKKINLIHEIVLPYFKFEMDDFYGDRGGRPYPKIEDLNLLYFKKKTRYENGSYLPSLTKKDEKAIIEKIKNLNIGKVEYYRIANFGKYIVIDNDVTDGEEDSLVFRYF